MKTVAWTGQSSLHTREIPSNAVMSKFMNQSYGEIVRPIRHHPTDYVVNKKIQDKTRLVLCSLRLCKIEMGKWPEN